VTVRSAPDLLNAIPLVPRHTRLRPPTSGENIEQSLAVLWPVVVCFRQVNPQSRRFFCVSDAVGDLARQLVEAVLRTTVVSRR